jgi:hypothetical protein
VNKKEMAKNPKITGWKSLWDNLKWGPRGALIAFTASSLILFVPLIPRVLFNLIIIFLVTILGTLIGALMGRIIKKSRAKK